MSAFVEPHYSKTNGGRGAMISSKHACIYCSLKFENLKKFKKYAHLLQCTLDVRFRYTACARLFDDVEKRDVFFGIS